MIIKLNESLNTDTYDNDFYIESILTEGTKYDKKAITKLVDSGLFDEETSTNIVNALFRQDIHAFVHAPAWLEKYLVGIVNMLIKYCDGNSSRAQEFLTDSIPVFEEYLTWVKDIRPTLPANKQLELDNEFNTQMSYQEVSNKLDSIKSQLDDESDTELATMKFSASSNYELIHIDSYEQFNQMFGGKATGDSTSSGTAWCHANSQTVYNEWTQGLKKFFVLASRDWKSIPFNAQSNLDNPKDTYGTSLIAILVNTITGRLLKATLRCNHVGVDTNADNQYRSYAKLSEAVGFNVKDAVTQYLKVNQPTVSVAFTGSKESLINYCTSINTEIHKLKSINIPDNVTSIEDYAFSGCKNLANVIIPDSVTSIGQCAFKDCSCLQNITIPNSVINLGGFAFEYCKRLTSVIIGDSITSIDPYTFFYCTSLVTIDIPDNITSIDNRAFYGCDSLTSVSIPDSVINIQDAAFAACNNLTIKCSENSYAHKYAIEHNIPVQLTEAISTKIKFKLNESNSHVNFSDKYNIFSYKDIPFVKEEALHIWDTLATGYSMIIRNSEGSSYTFEKTDNGMVRYETCKVYRTTTAKNNGDLTYADYKTEKPYSVAPEYEQANLKNAIGSGTATIKIMDKNNSMVSQIKRDFHLKYFPKLTERVIYDSETGKICLNYEGAEHIIAQALKDFDANFEWDSITVVSKNRMRIVRAIMQEFKEAGYESTRLSLPAQKTTEINISDGKYSGVRISVISDAVCNPEEQLITIEVYE